MRSFGPVEFELMLLRRMADYQPGLAADAVRGLGLAGADARAAHRRWQQMIRSGTFPAGMAGYRLVLGPPAEAGHRQAGDLRLAVARWPVRTWPGLCFETIALPGGPVLQSWLVRAAGTPAPPATAVSDLRPWQFVIADVERAFAPVSHSDDGTPSRWSTAFTASGPAGPRRHLARFAWGLLQAVDPMDRDPEGFSVLSTDRTTGSS